MALVLDTSAVYAALDTRDANHRLCRELIVSSNEPLVVPAPVLPEVDYLVSVRMHSAVFVTFLDDVIAGSYRIESLLDQDYPRIRDICQRYADADIGFVDAAVLAVVERLNEPKLATLDLRHFRALRPRHVDALRLLPADV